MNKTKRHPGLFAALGMLLLILDSKTALAGAGAGLELCIRTVIPSLFPFFLLSGVLVSSLMGSSVKLLRPLGRLLGMPVGTESLLVSGFLGGYPVGAKSIRDAWAEGHLSKSDAERMLSFCNNAGPAFLFGMAAPMFSGAYAGWVLWGIHLISALFAGFLLRGKDQTGTTLPSKNSITLSQAMQNALSVTAGVCGWVIAFRLLCAFLERWFLWLLPTWGQALVTGLLELTNGCVSLRSVSSENARFLLCSILLAFGGLCVHMQTRSVTRGLSLRYYVLGKLLQTGCSLFFSLMWLRKISPLFALLLPLLLTGKKNVKNSSILQPVGV